MDIYQLDYILHEPEESEGWMYLAEVPALQGCMAWGDTPEQTLDELRAVAKVLIQSRQERGVPLPLEVTPQRTGKGSFTVAARPTESCAESWNGSIDAESPPPRRSPIASTAAPSDTIADEPSDISAEHLDGHLC